MDEPAMSERHAARAGLYAFAAGLFTFPDEDGIDDLRAADTKSSVRDAADELGLVTEVDAVLDALDDASLETLESAYNDLFGIPQEGAYTVPPYEAHYTIGDDIGQQQRRIAAFVGLLEAVGLERDEAFAERHDHVVTELELMQVLAAQHALAARQESDEGEQSERDVDRLVEIQATVLDAHLIGFVPSFAHEVREATDHPLYGAAATLAERLVRRDHDEFADDRPPVPTGGEPEGSTS